MAGLAGGLVRLSHWVNRGAEVALALLAALLTGLVLVAVASRYLFSFSIVTSVELTRIAFVWACFLGASVGVARAAHVRLGFLVDALPFSGQRAATSFAALLTLGFAGAMVWQGTLLSLKMTATFLPALQWSQATLYAALPVSGAIIAVHALAALLQALAAGPEPAR